MHSGCGNSGSMVQSALNPSAFLLAAGLYYIGGATALTAFVTAALAHELGHLAAIAASGSVVREIRLTLFGPVIEYGGVLTRRQEVGIAAAGPVAGLLFAASCLFSARPYFMYAGEIALLASLFNLLPIYPMDGGRMARFLLETVLTPETSARILRILGSLCALGVACTGASMHSPAMIAAGLWMMGLANTSELR